MQAAESLGQDAAIQEGPELVLKESGPLRALRLGNGPDQEGIEMLLQHLVEYTLFGVSPFVFLTGMESAAMMSTGISRLAWSIR